MLNKGELRFLVENEAKAAFKRVYYDGGIMALGVVLLWPADEITDPAAIIFRIQELQNELSKIREGL